MKSSSTILIVLVAVAVAVADVSTLANRYLPPSAVENAILQDLSVTEASAEVITTSPSTTVVEIEQVPLEEMHYNEQSQQEKEQVQATEQPSLPSLPSLYEQPPALIYEDPFYEAQTDAPVAAVVPAKEAPVIEEASPEKDLEAPASEDVIVAEEVPRVDEISEVLDAVLSDPLNINDLAFTVDTAVVPASEDKPIVKESASAEVPLVESKSEAAHVLSSDGYRYKTANRFLYRF